MNYLVERSFIKDLKILPKDVKASVKEYFDIVEKATVFNELVQDLTKLTGYKIYYRYRVGDYRIGIAFRNETIIFIRVMHRKEIYKKLPRQ